MALTFPSTPNVNDIYQPSGSAASYRWTGTYWQIRQSANPLFRANQSGSVLQIDAAGYAVASPIIITGGQMTVTASSATSASYASTATSASFATSASYSESSSYSISSSFATSASYGLSASFATTASSVNTLRQDVTISGSLLLSGSSGPDGGELRFAYAQTGNTLTGSNVVIDVYQSRLRIYENGGTFRGAYLDLATAPAGVATNLGNTTPYYIQAGNASGQSITQQQVTTITGWTNTVVSTGSAWNASTGVFTVPRAGWYRLRNVVSYATNTAAIGAEFNAIISVNGANTYTGWTFKQTANSVIVTPPPVEGISFLNVGDTVAFRTYHDSGASRSLIVRGDVNLMTIQELPNFITK
jgi:hypothetical protein